jgi:hypothetical protein
MFFNRLCETAGTYNQKCDIRFVENPDDETFFAGFLAICEKVPDETFYIAIVYHEWFIIDEHI